MAEKFISISNNTREVYIFNVQDGNILCTVDLIPGLNLGVKESLALQFKDTKAFRCYQDRGFLTYIDASNEDIEDGLKEKHGKKIIENKETEEPMVVTVQEDIGKKKRYIPAKDMLVDLKGIGNVSAKKIRAQAEKSEWYSYGDMVREIQKDYPNAVFTKDDEKN